MATAPASRTALERRLSSRTDALCTSAAASCTAPSAPIRLPPRWTSSTEVLACRALAMAVAPESAISLKRSERTCSPPLTCSAAAMATAPWHLMWLRCRSSRRRLRLVASISASAAAPPLPMALALRSSDTSAPLRSTGARSCAPSLHRLSPPKASCATVLLPASVCVSSRMAEGESARSLIETSVKPAVSLSAAARQSAALSVSLRFAMRRPADASLESAVAIASSGCSLCRLQVSM
mmetsp:Transcript_53691/g.128698  ORF Transcript_53691/g.128698 Transcript_53691/m.128698 type:complete len:238 (-) Transcript_53691:71-784(-)